MADWQRDLNSVFFGWLVVLAKEGYSWNNCGPQSKKQTMSDFGTMVTVHRTDGTSTTPSDVAMIRRVAMDLVAPSPDRINEFADFNLRFGGSHKLRGTTGMMIALTEYCLGDDEMLIERDRPFAERFGEQLQEKIGPAFQVEIYCDHW